MLVLSLKVLDDFHLFLKRLLETVFSNGLRKCSLADNQYLFSLSDVHLIRPLWEDYKSTEAHKIEDTYDGHVSKILKRKVNQ